MRPKIPAWQQCLAPGEQGASESGLAVGPRCSEERDPEYVRRIFNEMVEEYDRLSPWYRHTFGGIDRILAQGFPVPCGVDPKPIALDIGAGTGIQSLRLAQLGYRVVGLDIAPKLLLVARKKLSQAGFSDAVFHLGDAQHLPFPAGMADCVNCCGPTLSFVPDWRCALAEIARCLKPGGRLVLEVEGRWTLDLLWALINALGFNFLRYDESLSRALAHFLRPRDAAQLLHYSFKLASGGTVTMPLWLFTARGLSRELRKLDLRTEKRWGFHSVTNLIPSPILHRSTLSENVEALFRKLAAIEAPLSTVWPFNSLANSLVVVARKTIK